MTGKRRSPDDPFRFPFTHDLAELVTLIEKSGHPVPDSVKPAVKLTRFAVAARYPGTIEAVSQSEYEEAVSLANTVLQWAEGFIQNS